MAYNVRILESREALDTCPRFHVEHFQWACLRRPATWGRMGWLQGEGLLLRMVCEEADPKRTLREPQSMVCNDSAMEAFFCFPKGGEMPGRESLYLNLEFNANGALHAKYGRGRKGRAPITEEEYRLTALRAGVEPGLWWAELTVPLPLLRRLYGVEGLEAGDRFYANFYKISEDPAIEHYASYRPIDSEKPDFHRPDQFAEMVVTSQ